MSITSIPDKDVGRPSAFSWVNGATTPIAMDVIGLMEMLGVPDLQIRQAAMDDLVKFRGNVDAIGVVCDHLKLEDGDARSRAVMALMQVAGKAKDKGNLHAVLSVSSLLKHSNPDIRKEAMVALSQIVQQGDPTAIAAVSSLLEHQDVNVRMDGVAALTWLAGKGDPQAISVLSGRLEDDNEEVRKGAMSALAQIAEVGDLQAIAAVSARLRHCSVDVKRDAIVALTQISDKGNPHSITALSACLQDESQMIRRAAMAALDQIVEKGDVNAVSTVGDQLSPQSGRVSREAVVALTQIDPHASVAVGSCLGHNDPFVRREAVAVLAQMSARGDPNAISMVRAKLRDESTSVREAATVALRKISGEEGEDIGPYEDCKEGALGMTSTPTFAAYADSPSTAVISDCGDCSPFRGKDERTLTVSTVSSSKDTQPLPAYSQSSSCADLVSSIQKAHALQTYVRERSESSSSALSVEDKILKFWDEQTPNRDDQTPSSSSSIFQKDHTGNVNGPFGSLPAVDIVSNAWPKHYKGDFDWSADCSAAVARADSAHDFSSVALPAETGGSYNSGLGEEEDACLAETGGMIVTSPDKSEGVGEMDAVLRAQDERDDLAAREAAPALFLSSITRASLKALSDDKLAASLRALSDDKLAASVRALSDDHGAISAPPTPQPSEMLPEAPKPSGTHLARAVNSDANANRCGPPTQQLLASAKAVRVSIRTMPLDEKKRDLASAKILAAPVSCSVDPPLHRRSVSPMIRVVSPVRSRSYSQEAFHSQRGPSRHSSPQGNQRQRSLSARELSADGRHICLSGRASVPQVLPPPWMNSQGGRAVVAVTQQSARTFTENPPLGSSRQSRTVNHYAATSGEHYTARVNHYSARTQLLPQAGAVPSGNVPLKVSKNRSVSPYPGVMSRSVSPCPGVTHSGAVPSGNLSRIVSDRVSRSVTPCPGVVSRSVSPCPGIVSRSVSPFPGVTAHGVGVPSVPQDHRTLLSEPLLATAKMVLPEPLPATYGHLSATYGQRQRQNSSGNVILA